MRPPLSAALAAAILLPAASLPAEEPLGLQWQTAGPYALLRLTIRNQGDQAFEVAEAGGEFQDAEGRTLAAFDGWYADILIREVRPDGEVWYPKKPEKPPEGEKPPPGFYPIGKKADPTQLIIPAGKETSLFVLGKMANPVEPAAVAVAIRAKDGRMLAYPEQGGAGLAGGRGVTGAELAKADPEKEINVIALKRADGWIIAEFALTNQGEDALPIGKIDAEYRGGSGTVRMGGSRAGMAFERDGFHFQKENSAGTTVAMGSVALGSKETRGFVVIGQPNGDAEMVNRILITVMTTDGREVKGEGRFGPPPGAPKKPAGGDDDDDDDKTKKDGKKEETKKKAGPDE